MKYLIAVDMEGVHGVEGVKYTGQSPYYAIAKDSTEYAKAVVSATDEVNTVSRALFDNGAEKVYLWDNHGGRDNLYMELVDSRVEKVDPPKEMATRLNFLADINVDGIIFIGYHSRAGSINGILCHTYNGLEIQYIKIDGKQVGELDIDSMIASVFGVPAIFCASDDVCLKQVKEYDARITTVQTKTGKGRTSAIFRPTEVVLSEIYDGVKKAMANRYPPIERKFPLRLEKRFTKMELAAYYYELNKERFGERLCFGDDANTLCATVNDIDELRALV